MAGLDEIKASQEPGITGPASNMCNCKQVKKMDTAQLTKLGIAAGIVFAGFKFGNPMIRAGAVAIGAVIAAKQVPYLNEVI